METSAAPAVPNALSLAVEQEAVVAGMRLEKNIVAQNAIFLLAVSSFGISQSGYRKTRNWHRNRPRAVNGMIDHPKIFFYITPS